MALIYVPIVKGKEGEYAALGALNISVRQQVIPLIEIPGIPYDYVNNRPARSLDAHVQGVARKVDSCWGAERPIYIDFSAHADGELLGDGTHVLQLVLSEARKIGVQAIPVVYTSSSPECLSEASLHAREMQQGVCLRLLVGDFDEEVDLETRINAILEILQLGESEIDVILDLEEIQDDLQRSILVARALLGGVPRPTTWRRLILAASSFPEDLRDVNAATVTTLPRREWELWGALNRRPERLPRRDLVYADYGITHPSLRELDPRTMRMSASIRYTGRDEWVIVKGRNVRQFGFEQYFDLCEALVQHPSFTGRELSWGDGFIADTAARKAGPGNATTWRKVGTNHHITLVAIQLATLNGP